MLRTFEERFFWGTAESAEVTEFKKFRTLVPRFLCIPWLIIF